MHRIPLVAAREQRLLKQALSLLSMMEGCIFFAPGLATFIVLVVHRYGLGKHMEIESAFALLGLFNLLTKQLNVFPRALKTFDESFVSFKRVERFLRLPELERLSAGHTTGGDVGLLLEAVTARWDVAAAPSPAVAATTSAAPAVDGFALSGVSISVRRGELCLVTGEVGAGKSSMLQLILGELPASSGAVGGSALAEARASGGIGYVPQRAWILNTSLRENILLGRPYEPQWYAEVVRRCALEHDLGTMAEGDLTEIGERGVSISGGQKARISLARAVYGRPPLVLLDDPLSAVDAHVARHLVTELLVGLLKRSATTVVLVTHQVQHAAELADRVVVLKGGRVTASGTVNDLAGGHGLELFATCGKDLAKEPETRQQLTGGDGGEKAGCANAMDAAMHTATYTATRVATQATTPPGVLTAAEAQQPAGAASSAAGKHRAPTAALKSTTREPAAREMGTAHTRRAALGFYLSRAGVGGSLAVLTLFVALGVCRALSDWALGSWLRGGQRDDGIAMYALFTCATVTLGLLQAAAFANRAIAVATSAHSAALARVLRAPKAFFDVTPLGLVMALFSKDLDALDDLLPTTTINLLKCVCIVTTAIVVCATAVPAALGIVPPLLLLFHRLTNYYQRSAAQLKRLDKASSGPVYSFYAETLGGLASVGSFGLTN